MVDRQLLTYSALSTFRACPRKYRLRYEDHLRPRQTAEALSFGSMIHTALELWHGDASVAKVAEHIDKYYAGQDRKHWNLGRAMMIGYVRRYPTEEWKVVALEQQFRGDIRNPATGRISHTFSIAGKVDGIVQFPNGETYLLEHKTAASIDGNYLDKLWADTQIALYCYYLRQLGYPIVGVIYNVLVKAKLKQSEGETEDEFVVRHADLCAKNKSGKSSATRHMPEADEEFQARLAEWYAQPGAFHREPLYFDERRMAMLEDEVWEVTQQYLGARRRCQWFMNTGSCFACNRPCSYLPLCQSGNDPNVYDNLYEVVEPHEELRDSLPVVEPEPEPF